MKQNQNQQNVNGNKHLNIGMRLPSDYLTKRGAILAKVGSGKTYLAGKLEEQLAKQGLPFVVIDPMGAHWGIRTHYPILIIGGEYGDIDLEVHDGAYIAKLIVAQNLSCIIDINQWTKNDQQHFAADFGNELFLLHKKTSSPRHVIWEEADIFAPQRTKAVSLSVLDTLVRRGRQFGLGTTVITQRPAVLNKDILTQCDAYFFMNMVASQDIKVIQELLQSSNATKDERKDYIERILKFNQGECLLFAPSWIGLKVFKGSKREAYHAGQTPVYGIPQRIPPLLMYETQHIKYALNVITGAIKEEVTKTIELTPEVSKRLYVIIVLAAGAALYALFL